MAAQDLNNHPVDLTEDWLNDIDLDFSDSTDALDFDVPAPPEVSSPSRTVKSQPSKNSITNSMWDAGIVSDKPDAEKTVSEKSSARSASSAGSVKLSEMKSTDIPALSSLGEAASKPAPAKTALTGGLSKPAPSKPALTGGLPKPAPSKPALIGGLSKPAPAKTALTGGLPKPAPSKPALTGGLPKPAPAKPVPAKSPMAAGLPKASPATSVIPPQDISKKSSGSDQAETYKAAPVPLALLSTQTIAAAVPQMPSLEKSAETAKTHQSAENVSTPEKQAVSSLMDCGWDETLLEDDTSLDITFNDFDFDEAPVSELNSIGENAGTTVEILNPAEEERQFTGEYTVEPVDLGEDSIEKLKASQSVRYGSYMEQFVQYLNSILLRLMDDVELVFQYNAMDEAIDLSKQLHRLGNILAFQGIEDQSSLIVYLITLLPISFASTEIGEPVRLQRDRDKETFLAQQCPEFLSCMNYLLEDLDHRISAFESVRFRSHLLKIYGALNLAPAAPSPNAPLPMNENDCGYGFTTRTKFKIIRFLESQLMDAVNFIESSALYGYRSGYSEAIQCLRDSETLCSEYELNRAADAYSSLSYYIYQLTTKDKPNEQMYELFEKLVAQLESYFPDIRFDEPLQGLKSIVDRFCLCQKSTVDGEPFAVRWKLFYAEADHIIFPVPTSDVDALNIISELLNLSRKYRLDSVKQILIELSKRWHPFPISCFEAFQIFLNDLRAAADKFTCEENVEDLIGEKLRVIFDRKDFDRLLTAGEFLEHCNAFLTEFQKNIESPALISHPMLINLLIDARRIKCHSIIRICEVLSALLDRIPRIKNPARKVTYPDSLIDSLYFSNELLTRCIHALQVAYNHGRFEDSARLLTIFYRAILSLYTIDNQPNDPTLLYVIQHLKEITNSINLIWSTTSTPTSTQYYCDLVRKLLHIMMILDLPNASNLVMEHLADVPDNPYINTKNITLERQYYRILKVIDESMLSPPVVSDREDIRTFFLRAINACQFLAASQLDSVMLSQQLGQVSGMLFPIAMASDSMPVMAVAFDLRDLSYQKLLTQQDVEELLYWFIRVAHNICPGWAQNDYQELEFLSVSQMVPVTMLQKHFGTIVKLYNTLKDRATSIPTAWEYIQNIYDQAQSMMAVPRFGIQNIMINARNRAAYLKRHINFKTNLADLCDDGKYSFSSNLPVYQAFLSTVQSFVHAFIDHAFVTTMPLSSIEVNLSVQDDAISASVSHNGDCFTEDEIRDVLKKLNMIPAPEDNILDLLVQAKKVYKGYPPATQIAYGMNIVRQFNGEIEFFSKDGKSYVQLQFPLIG